MNLSEPSADFPPPGEHPSAPPPPAPPAPGWWQAADGNWYPPETSPGAPPPPPPPLGYAPPPEYGPPPAHGAAPPIDGGPTAAYGPTPAYGPPPVYGGAGYGYTGSTPTARTNGLAIASLVLGILWLDWIGSILALVFGYVALGQIKRRNQGGRGLALTGVILGWVGVGLLGALVIGVAARS